MLPIKLVVKPFYGAVQLAYRWSIWGMIYGKLLVVIGKWTSMYCRLDDLMACSSVENAGGSGLVFRGSVFEIPRIVIVNCIRRGTL